MCVEHLLADTLYDVMLDGFAAGAILTDDEGEGCLRFSTREVGGAEPLPPDLDPVNELGHVDVSLAGIVVLAGEFADAKWHGTSQHGEESAFAAFLRDGDGDIVGALIAKAEEDEQELELKAWGLEPFATYQVVLDGNVLVTLVADAQGHLEGEWENPADDEELLPDEFLPVSGLLHGELQTTDGDVVAEGDFSALAKHAGTGTLRSVRRRPGLR